MNTNKEKLNWDLPIQTRKGLAARFIGNITTKEQHIFIIKCVVAIKEKDGTENVVILNEDGSVYKKGVPFDWDVTNISIQFPPPPEGEEWHNPFDFTAERVGVHEGWRLRLRSEMYSTEGKDQFWESNLHHKWMDLNIFRHNGRLPDLIYRTQDPLPTKPILIQWEKPSDVPHNLLWLKFKAWGSEECKICSCIRPQGLEANSSGLIHWSDLLENWLWSDNSRREWRICGKSKA